MIQTLTDILYALGANTVRSVWLPLIGWTIFALPAYAWIRREERVHPAVRYYLQRAVFLTLPAGLLAVNLVDVSAWMAGPASGAPAAVDSGGVYVLLPTVEAAAAGSTGWGIYLAVGLLSIAAGGVAVYQLLRLVGELIFLGSFTRRIAGNRRIESRRRAYRMARKIHGSRPVDVVVTSEKVPPMTFGWRRPTVVIPDEIARNESRLRMTLIHEFAHVRRWDYLWHCAERFIGACLAIHPLVGRLRAEIGVLREMVCDAEVLQNVACDPRQYAMLLYDTVTSDGERTSFAMAMSERGKNLKRRINAMKDSEQRSNGLVTSQRIGLSLGALVLAAGVALVSCTDIVGPQNPASSPAASNQAVNEQEAPSSADADGDAEVFVAVDQMPTLENGIQELQQAVRYPEQARAAGVEGTVIVHFVVDKNGDVENPEILRGIGAGCDEEALRVVREAEFAPGRTADGNLVKIKMSLPIRFSLGDGRASTGDAGEQASGAINLEIGDDESLRLNDRPIELDDLKAALDGLLDGSGKTVSVRIAGGVTMGFVETVQKQLRAADALRIDYRTRRS